MGIRDYPMNSALSGLVVVWVCFSGAAAAERPFIPYLTIGQDLPLCESLKRRAHENFDTEFISVRAREDLDIAAWGHWTILYQPEPGDGRYSAGRNEVALLDISGTDGPTRYLLRHSRTHSWRGDQNAFAFVDTEERAREWAETIASDAYGTQRLFDFENPPEGFTPVHDRPHYAYIAAPEDAFLFDDDAYLFRPAYGATESDPDTIALELISPDGVEVSCELVVAPSWREVIGSLPEPVSDWIEALELMRGEPGMGFCGTAYGHFWSGADRHFYGTLSNTLYRPNLPNDDYLVTGRHRNPESARLEAWGRNDMRSWQISRGVQDGRQPALTALQAWFADAYEVDRDQAIVWAERALGQVFDATYYQTTIALPEAQPRSGPLLANEAAIGSAVAQYAELSETPPWDVPPEPPLSLLLDNLAAMRGLIAGGAGVDDANAFGKTPLMMAAHLNMIGAATLLVAAGADANARTHDPGSVGECYYGIRRHERSALMYAAENAGPDMMALLLAANADPTAEDSQGQTLWDYLDRNNKNNEDELAHMRSMLIEAGLEVPEPE